MVCELSGVRGWFRSRCHHSYFWTYDGAGSALLGRSIPSMDARRCRSAIEVSDGAVTGTSAPVVGEAKLKV